MYGAARPRVEVEAELRSAFANPSFVGAITLMAMLDPASERDQGAKRTLHAVPYPMLCTLVGLVLGWVPLLIHGPHPSKCR